MEWNMNGANTKTPGVRKNVRLNKITTTKEIDNKALEDEELKEIVYLERGIRDRTCRIDSPGSRLFTERYIYLEIKQLLKDTVLFEEYYNHAVVIQNTLERPDANYLAMKVNILFFSTEDEYKSGYPRSNISFELRELFGNCSSVVLNRLRIPYNDTSQGGLDICNKVMTIVDNLITMANYTTALYSTSSRETSTATVAYMEKNWKCLHSFNNKRGGAEIKYFIKSF